MWLVFSCGFLLHISWKTFLCQSIYKNVQLLTWRVVDQSPAQMAILAAVLVALLFTLCVRWINYGQHTPDKVPIVVVVIDWIQDSARACWPLLTKCSLQARLRSEHAPSHITARSYHPSQSANLDRGPWENWDESEVSGPTFRQTYQQQQYHSLITSAKIKQFVVRIQLWASDNKETYEHECRGFENLKKYSWQCSAQCGGWGLGYKLDNVNVLLSELWRDIRFSS